MQNGTASNPLSVILFVATLLSNQCLEAQEVWLLKSPAHDVQIQELEVRQIIQDRKGLLWAATLNGLVRYDGYQCRFYRYEAGKSSGLAHSFVTGLLEDAAGKYIWLTTYGGGLHRFNPRKDLIEPFPFTIAGHTISNALNCMATDETGALWTGGLQLLFKMDTGTLQYEKLDCLPGNQQQPEVLCIAPTTAGKLWLATTKGLVEFDTQTKTGKYVADSEGKIARFILQDSRRRVIAGIANNIFVAHLGEPGHIRQFSFSKQPFNAINTIAEADADEYWLCTDKGLWRWKYGDETARPVVLYDQAREKRSDFEVTCILKDAAGDWWIGTRYNGFWQIVPEYFHPIPSRSIDGISLRHATVTAIYQSDERLLWIGTLKGLQLFDLKSRQEIIPKTDFKKSLFTNRITCIIKDAQGNHWVGTAAGGYYSIASLEDFIERGQLEHFTLTDQQSGESITPNSAMRMMEDAQGNLWIGTFTDGIHIRRPKFNDIVVLKNIPQDSASLSWNAISSIVSDHSGNIWVGTYGGGLNRYLSPQAEMPVNRFEHFYHDTSNINSLSHNIALSVYPDLHGNVWIGVYGGGLNHLDYKQKKWRLFTTEAGLAGSLVYSILPDEAGNLWLSTESGLSHLMVQENRFVNYTDRNGLPFNRHYFFSASRHAPSGRLFFGGTGGMYSFRPGELREDAPLPECQITEFRLFNKTVPVAPDGVLDEDIGYKTDLLLNYDQSVITFQLSAVNFTNPEQNLYAYKLEGFDKDWNYIGHQREITHTNLDPGTYTFYYKAADYRGVWGPERTLKIYIEPPFWATWWAYLIYLLAFSGLIYWVYRFNLKRQLAYAEAVRLKELDTTKSRLYANITHEFRTPLTVILGMAKQVLDNPKEHFRTGLEMIVRNGRQVLLLVNQMLDLSKLEGGKMKLHPVQSDIVQYIKYLIESYQSWAENKDIQMHFLADMDALVMDFDPERLQQVVSNLLSNAIKFTEAGGHIYLSVSRVPPQQLQINVRDTGVGIPEAKLPHIFDRFYQVDDSHTRQREGTGIGLALTKELVNLMDGTIEVQSQSRKGSVFSVLLPITNTAPLEQPVVVSSDFSVATAVIQNVQDWNGSSETQPLVLVADDNPDVVHYLVTCLEALYRIEVAKDGQEALDKATELIPDLIILDVMMPRKDGFEVCHLLKNDARTSHIPVIMLTAKADAESRLQGIERGADAYLPKPFQPDELYVHIRKLLELRQKLQQFYRSQADLAPEEKADIQATENVFVQNARTVVLRNLGDEHFSVEQFCKELHMSHSHLHRKLIALTGLSATRFIRHVRLNAAREMFKDARLTIAAIASDTGFSDPSYFGRIFKKEFGMTPAEWREKVLKP